jgi:hypothetical protein
VSVITNFQANNYYIYTYKRDIRNDKTDRKKQQQQQQQQQQQVEMSPVRAVS